MKNQAKNKPNDIILDKKVVKNGDLPVKVFASRNSVLTDLFKEKNFNTFYGILMAIFIAFILSSALQQYLDNNEILGLRLIKNGFSPFHIFTLVWMSTFLSVLLWFYAFKIWAIVTVRLSKKSFLLQLWKYLGLLCLVLFYAAILYFPTLYMIRFNFGVACAVAITSEVTRFLMKVHSFLRSNISKIYQYTPNKDKQLYPNFSNYFYFLFAPTLIYKDTYPKSKEGISWNYIINGFLEFGFGVFLLSCIFEMGYIPLIKDYGLKPYTATDILMIVLKCFPFGTVITMIFFYLGLHVWFNCFAEMLGFSDRLFYKDWWTAQTYDVYYRKWNVVVHDWLYTYVYKDFYENIIKSKLLAKFLVFFLSGVFHEYVFSAACGFFLPIVIVQMFITVAIMEVSKLFKSQMANTSFWFSMSFGISLNSTMYLIEHYARINCPVPDSELSRYDFFIPRFLSCYK